MHEIETHCCDVNAPQTLLPPRGAEKCVCEMAAISIWCCTSEELDEDYDVKRFSENNFGRKKRKNVQGMECDIKVFYLRY